MKERIKKIWNDNWLLSRIKKFLPKDQTGRMKGEFNMGGDLMGSVFYKDKNGNISQSSKKSVKNEKNYGG